LLDEAVDRRGGARDQRDADGAEENRHDRRQAGDREKHADHRDKDDQRHDARLRQREKLPEPVLRKGERRHEVVGLPDAKSCWNFTIVGPSTPPIRDACSKRAISCARPLMSGSPGYESTRLPMGSINQMPERAPGNEARALAGTRATTSPGCCVRNSREGEGSPPPVSSHTRTTRSRSLPCIVRACRMA